MNRDYRQEDVLQHAREAFAETVLLKVQQLRRYVPKGSNPDLTGAYIEEVVRSFVRDWIGHRLLLHGTFHSKEFADSGEKPLQIDGIVYDPTSGPLVLRGGDFAVVHPAFCTSVIEIKTSYQGKMTAFEHRLQEIYAKYMHHVTKPQVMGIVIADKDPDKASQIQWNEETTFYGYNYKIANWCPIFILFKEENDEYEPFYPAIDAMIRAIYTNQFSAGNYL